MSKDTNQQELLEKIVEGFNKLSKDKGKVSNEELADRIRELESKMEDVLDFLEKMLDEALDGGAGSDESEEFKPPKKDKKRKAKKQKK